MTIVDAHLHLWDATRLGISWFRPELGLPAVAATEDYVYAARDLDLRGAVAVQAADTAAEALWLLDRAAEAPMPLAVVVQYEPAPERHGHWAGAMQATLTTDGSGASGVRLAAPSAASDLTDVVGLDALAAGLAHTGRPLDVLVRPDQLPAVGALADRHPDLAIILCHIGLGGGSADTAWRSALADLADRERIAAKVSGLHPERRSAGELVDIVGHAASVFGPDRLMFGSDWPISARSLALDELVGRVEEALPREWGASQRERFWHGNAQTRYAVPSS